MTYKLSTKGHAKFTPDAGKTPKKVEFTDYLRKHRGDIKTVFGAVRIASGREHSDEMASSDILDSRLVVNGCYGMGKKR
jgi:hypothetical protein